jgi:hypothetical protein
VPSRLSSFKLAFLQRARWTASTKRRGLSCTSSLTGLRLSEAANLQRHTIHLDAQIPYIEVLPDGRRLKTEDSRREIPLVGVALVRQGDPARTRFQVLAVNRFHFAVAAVGREQATGEFFCTSLVSKLVELGLEFLKHWQVYVASSSMNHASSTSARSVR